MKAFILGRKVLRSRDFVTIVQSESR